MWLIYFRELRWHYIGFYIGLCMVNNGRHFFCYTYRLNNFLTSNYNMNTYTFVDSLYLVANITAHLLAAFQVYKARRCREFSYMIVPWLIIFLLLFSGIGQAASQYLLRLTSRAIVTVGEGVGQIPLTEQRRV